MEQIFEYSSQKHFLDNLWSSKDEVNPYLINISFNSHFITPE